MSERTYVAVGIGLGALIGIMALVGAVVDNWDTWWVVLAICGTVTGLWWAIGSMYVEEEPEPKSVDAVE